jgi:hypothetical protein
MSPNNYFLLSRRKGNNDINRSYAYQLRIHYIRTGTLQYQFFALLMHLQAEKKLKLGQQKSL